MSKDPPPEKQVPSGGPNDGPAGGKGQDPKKPSPPPAGDGGGAPAAGAHEGKDLSTSYLLAEINEFFKSDRIFHTIVTSKGQFNDLLGKIGKVPFKHRGQIARNLEAVIKLNPRLLQDTKVFQGINLIMRNLPATDQNVKEFVSKTLLRLREALIKNRRALNLGNPVMQEYSSVIQKFLIFVSKKIKNEFFASLDSEIMNFILGKHTKKDTPEKAKKEDTLFDDDDDDEEEDSEKIKTRMDYLVSILFNDVMRLEPDLVSAAILSIVTQLPHGDMRIEDPKLVKRWVASLE